VLEVELTSLLLVSPSLTLLPLPFTVSLFPLSDCFFSFFKSGNNDMGASDMEASEVIDRGNAMSVLVSEWNKA